MKSPVIEIPKLFLVFLNNLSEIERKLALNGDPGNAKRNVERIKDAFETEKLFYEDPLGQKFNETRTDLDAMITGNGADNLVVVEVMKPIIRYGDHQYSRVIQKGIVVVESKTANEESKGE